MDNFMSKLSQKINAQDVIKANFMADTAEKERMKKQLEEYESMMQNVRELYEKQIENQARLSSLLEQLDKNAASGTQPEMIKEFKEQISRSDEFTHKECVKVYRNVQALLEEQDKLAATQTEALKEEVAGLAEKTQELKAEILLLEGQAESVKKQIEASKPKDMTDDLDEIKRMVVKTNRSSKALLWLLLLASAANIAIVLLIHFGLF